MNEPRYFSREEAREITERVLGFSQADEARINLQSGLRGDTRFAVNQPTTSGDILDASLTVTSAFGRRVASSTTNRFDDESLQRVVQTSEELARLVPEDPEYPGELDEQRYPESEAYFESTGALSPAARADAVEQIAGPARQRDLQSTGFLVYDGGARAVATSRGLFAYHAESRANLTTTVRTPDGTGSGWAGAGAHDWSRIRPGELGETAIRKAEMSSEPRAIEPGAWTVVLEPTAVGNMVNLMTWQLGARQADEGRSFFSRPGGENRIDERFVDERVTIHSDPNSAELFSSPFNSEGLPNQRMMWVEDGILRNLSYDRFWAREQGREPTGFVSGFSMAGGESSVDEMIASTERGLLVTRFWYIRPVDPRTILYTGLTRDGTFLIENGRVTHPVQNLRWNESPIFMLNNIEAMGEPVRISSSESGGVAASVIVPPLKVRDFTFTSLSDAV